MQLLLIFSVKWPQFISAHTALVLSRSSWSAEWRKAKGW